MQSLTSNWYFWKYPQTCWLYLYDPLKRLSKYLYLQVSSIRPSWISLQVSGNEAEIRGMCWFSKDLKYTERGYSVGVINGKCDVCRMRLHSRDTKAYFTLHFILIPWTTAGESKHADTSEYILNICQTCTNTHTDNKNRSKNMQFHIQKLIYALVCLPSTIKLGGFGGME